MWDKCEGGCGEKVWKVGNRKYCLECAKRIHAARCNKHAKERNSVSRSGLPPTFTCPYCKKTVPRRQSNQKICGDKACKREYSPQYRSRIYADRAKNGKSVRKPFLCICGKKVTPQRSDQKSCGSRACFSKIWSRANSEMLLGDVSIRCVICKKEVRRRDKRQVTCLSEACKAKQKASLQTALRRRQRQLSAMAQSILMVDSIKEASRKTPKKNPRKTPKKKKPVKSIRKNPEK